MSEQKQNSTFRSVEEMISHVEVIGNLDIILNGERHGLACNFGYDHRPCSWHWDVSDIEFETLHDALYTPVFDGKSLVDLFYVADFSPM